jgi:hypothetical protein
VDVCRLLVGRTDVAYALVFGAEASLFLLATALAIRVGRTLEREGVRHQAVPVTALAGASGGP